ncbi:MAG: hypothetical protein AB7H97_10295 [Pseudobdellovibrionaceae bacterium]
MDKRKKQNHFVNLEFLSVFPNQMRMEASATLGISAASMVLNDQKLEMLLPRQEKYYFGRAKASAIRPALRIDLEPQILIDLLFDKTPRSRLWSCEKDELSRPKICENKTSGQQIQYDRTDIKKRKITLKASQYELQIVFQSDATKVELASNWLDLEVPNDYERIELK